MMPLSAHIGIAGMAACVAIAASSLGIGVALWMVVAAIGEGGER